MDLPNIRLSAGTEAKKTRTPVESLLLAYAGVLPTAAGAIASWLYAPDAIIRLTIIWAAAILCFLAGVRRGLAFRQPGGPTLLELATMFATFVIGLAALLVPWPMVALILLLVGYAEISVADVVGARHHEAPPYFARLRPPQMTIAILALIVLLARVMN
jgi:hypothetical protein